MIKEMKEKEIKQKVIKEKEIEEKEIKEIEIKEIEMKEKELKEKVKNINEDTIKNNAILFHHGYTLSNDVLGSGTFSTVLAAYSNTLRTDVAVKVIQKVSGAKIFLTKFLPRELETMKALIHPNVITFLQAIETNIKVCISFFFVISKFK